MKEKLTKIKVERWSSWGVEVFSRETEGKTEFAYIVEEQKWVDIYVKGDFSFSPVSQNIALAPLFRDDQLVCLEANIVDEITDGGYMGVEFNDQRTLDAWGALKESTSNDDDRELLYEMGFKDYDDDCYKIVLKPQGFELADGGADS